MIHYKMNSETQFIGSITKRRQCFVHSVEDRSFFILSRVPEWFYMVIATVREVCVLIMRHSEKAPVCYEDVYDLSTTGRLSTIHPLKTLSFQTEDIYLMLFRLYLQVKVFV